MMHMSKKVLGRQTKASRVTLRCSHQVFQTAPPLRQVSMGDVSDALDTASSFADVADRVVYCDSLGIDYTKAAAYYERVRILNRSTVVDVCQY
jgi:hypothetical protein